MTQHVHNVDNSTGTRLLLLGWGIIWRLTVWGLVAGMLVGSLYGCVVVFLAGGLYGFAFGAVFGLVAGFLCGVVMAVMTFVTLPRIRERNRYTGALAFVPVGVILVLEALLIITSVATDLRLYFHGVALPDFLVEEWTRLLGNRWQVFMYYLPGIISLVPAWYAGRQVARWAAGEQVWTS